MQSRKSRSSSLRLLVVPGLLTVLAIGAANAAPVVSGEVPAHARDAQGAVTSTLLPGGSVEKAQADTSMAPLAASVKCTDSGTAAFRDEFLQRTNAYRATGRNCGSTWYPAAKPLVWNKPLKRSAQGHSRDMATKNFFSHTGSNGSSMVDRDEDAGYTHWSALGENIAAGYADAAAVMNGWITSPGHCANIMGAQYKDLGVACSYNSNSTYGSYWTMEVGAQF